MYPNAFLLEPLGLISQSASGDSHSLELFQYATWEPTEPGFPDNPDSLLQDILFEEAIILQSSERLPIHDLYILDTKLPSGTTWLKQYYTLAVPSETQRVTDNEAKLFRTKTNISKRAKDFRPQTRHNPQSQMPFESTGALKCYALHCDGS